MKGCNFAALMPNPAAGIFALCFFLIAAFVAPAQEAEIYDELAAAENDNGELYNGDADIAAYQPPPPPAEEPHPEADFLELEIRTSSLMELAAWARELGLSDGGTRSDLAARLRAFFRLPAPMGQDFVEQRVITIESANITEYFTLAAVDEDYARFRGDVIISLRDGYSVHRIRAGEILFNRTRNVLSASGGVEYTREEGTTTEIFRGESITVNLDNWSSIFIDGVTERMMEGSPSAYRFEGTIISRDAEGATLLRNATITNPATDETFWSISASRLWLLPGNDFAIANAVLRVGNIPLFYLPFFFFPADQVVFRPVLGFRSREGTFMQTTTYVLGRPRTEVLTDSSISMIFGGAGEDMETERHGIFLRTTGERRQDPSDVRLSFLVDAYVNLGVFLGTELALPAGGVFGETTVSAGLGFSRNIFNIDGVFTPFPNFDGESEWNRSQFFFTDVPFRYRFEMTGSFVTPAGSLSWDIPFFSDPFVDRDFMNRPQPGDWFSMLRDFAESDEEVLTDTGDFLSSYQWRILGNFNFPTAALHPAISSLSISQFLTSLEFNMRGSTVGHPNPDSAFFFPQRLILFSLTASMAGTPFAFGAPEPFTPGIGPPPGLAMLPDLPISPWQTPEENDDGALAADERMFSPPVLAQTFTIRTGGGPRLTIDYRLTPTASTEMQFDSRMRPGHWDIQENVDWTDISSIQSRFNLGSDFGFNLTHAGIGAYSASFRILGRGSWANYWMMNEEAGEFLDAAGNPDETRVLAALDSANNATGFSTSWTFNTSVRPFFQSDIWGNTNITYDLHGLLVRNRFDLPTGTPAGQGERIWETGSWDRDNISVHRIATNIVANVMDQNQNVTITTALPPLAATATLNATFNKWISTTTINTTVTEPWNREDREFGDIRITEILNFTPNINFRQEFVINPEIGQSTTLISTLNLWAFNASYSVLYTRPYRFNPNFVIGGGENLWQQLADPSLEAQFFRFGYNRTFSRTNLWGGRLALSLNINTSVNFDLQRYTQSYLNFNMNFTARITNLFELSFTTLSRNDVLFRYFQNMPFFNAAPVDLFPGQETNILVDLINSFRFDNQDLRRSSGFKLRSMNVRLLYRLGDWNARFTVRSSPVLSGIGADATFRFQNEISFVVQWVPISEIRAQVHYEENRLTVR